MDITSGHTMAEQTGTVIEHNIKLIVYGVERAAVILNRSRNQRKRSMGNIDVKLPGIGYNRISPYLKTGYYSIGMLIVCYVCTIKIERQHIFKNLDSEFNQGVDMSEQVLRNRSIRYRGNRKKDD